jgi:type IX secretion system PorP/SprF family membrane protein
MRKKVVTLINIKKHMSKVGIRYILIFICLIIVGVALKAQDIHYSQYNYAPLQLNPALAGLNNCDYRLALNGRTQWNTISGSGNTYSTFGASADFAIGKVTKFNSFAGIGVSVSSDIAGTTSYNTNRADITAAYHFMIDRRGNASLSAGLQFAVNHRGFDASKSTFDGQYDPMTGRYDGSRPGETFARTNMLYVDAGVGLLYSQYFKRKKNNIYIGLAVNHVNQPNISWSSSGLYNNTGNDRLYAKTTFHGGGSFQVGDKIWIMPTFMFLFQGPSQQYNFGSLVRMRVGNTISTSFFYLGAQFRAPLDAVILQTRFDYKGFMLGFSYDINVSKLIPASQTMGAPELAIMYTGCMRKKPHPFLCPTM